MSKIPSFADARNCSEQKERLSSLKEMPIPKGASNCLSGCVFVMTGTLPALTRAKAKKLIEEYGGEVASSINSRTNIILKGYDEETSKKLQDAQKKGIKITDQEGLFKYIASTDPDKEEKSEDISDVCQSSSNNDNNNISIPEIKEYINKKCDLQTNLLNYLDDSQNVEENYQTLSQVIDNQNISKNKIELATFLQLISKISINHQRFPNFFSKIEKVLINFSDEMKEFYSNDELINIFKNSKRILLYLIQEKLIIVDENFIKKISKDKYIKKLYPQYFSPEVNPFKNEKCLLNYNNPLFSSTYLYEDHQDYYFPNIKKTHPFIVALEEFKEPENFNENRLIGENEDEICRLIRQDLIKDFIVYVNKENVDLKMPIKKSIYETNSLLLKNQGNITLIEYAAFYGSIQIFKYLLNNEVELTESLWMYAVHGQNSEIFNILEENKIELPKEITNENDDNKNKEEEEKEEEDHDDVLEHRAKVVTFEDCFFEAIKCHHNEVASFIESYILQTEKTNSLKYISIYLKHHNLSFNRECVIDESSLFYLCKYNHYYILELLLKNKNIDVNKIEIFNSILIQFFFLFNFYGIFIYLF